MATPKSFFGRIRVRGHMKQVRKKGGVISQVYVKPSTRKPEEAVLEFSLIDG